MHFDALIYQNIHCVVKLVYYVLIQNVSFSVFQNVSPVRFCSGFWLKVWLHECVSGAVSCPVLISSSVNVCVESYFPLVWFLVTDSGSTPGPLLSHHNGKIRLSSCFRTNKLLQETSPVRQGSFKIKSHEEEAKKIKKYILHFTKHLCSNVIILNIFW